LKIFNALAASIVGIPTRNVNSVAATRFRPIISANNIVVPEREAPGKPAAISCPIPTAKAMGQVT